MPDPLVAQLDGDVEVARRAGSSFYHTIVWPYLPDAVREAAEATVAAAGERAGAEAPLALLAFEGTREDPSRIEVHLTEWPGGERRLLARTSHHPGHGGVVGVSAMPRRAASPPARPRA
jgi:hypothetical protein